MHNGVYVRSAPRRPLVGYLPRLGASTPGTLVYPYPHACCNAHSATLDPHHRPTFSMSVPYLPLEVWKKHWKVDGSRVRCRLCGSVQELSDPDMFSHTLGCKAWGRQAQYPSRELASLLQQKIQLGLF